MTVPSITDDLIADIEAAASAATGGDWEYRLGLVRTLPDSDGYVPVTVAPNVPKNWREQRDKNMQHIANCSPSTILALITRLRDSERGAEDAREQSRVLAASLDASYSYNKQYRERLEAAEDKLAAVRAAITKERTE